MFGRIHKAAAPVPEYESDPLGSLVRAILTERGLSDPAAREFWERLRPYPYRQDPRPVVRYLLAELDQADHSI